MRFIGLPLTMTFLTLLAAALDAQPGKEQELVLKKKAAKDGKKEEPAKEDPLKDKKDDPKDPKKIEPKDLPPIGGQEKPEEIIARVKKNMEASAKRLEEKDPGDTTRRIQRDIVKDLDDLINQEDENNKSNQGQGGQGGRKGGRKNKGGQKQAERNKQELKKTGESKGEPNKAENKPGNPNPKDQPGEAKDQKPPNPDQAGKPKDDGANGKGDPKAGQAKDQGKGRNPAGNFNTPNAKAGAKKAADLDIEWDPRLPRNVRQQLDTMADDRFLPRYQHLIDQYYRTIFKDGLPPD